MTEVLQAAWLVLWVCLALPVGVLVFEMAHAAGTTLRPSRTTQDGGATNASAAPADQALGTPPRTAVLIPAHNEAEGLGQTLAPLMAAAGPHFSVWVVADNCTDATAAVARAAGAQVVERQDAQRRGKGYALHAGVAALATAQPDVVVVLDADCQASAPGLVRLAHACHQVQRPLQAAYLMQAPPGAGLGLRIAEFAWRVKTWVRPLGWMRSGHGGSLLGSGMAFPASVLRALPLDSGHITEDLSLSFRLAETGMTPLFWPETTVFSEFPASESAQASQRTRWEHGHLGILFTEVPRAMAQGLRHGRAAQWSLALYALVPPLALLVLSLGAAVMLALLTAALAGVWWPLAALCLLGGLMVGSLAYAWRRWAQDVMPASDWLQIPAYIWRKLNIYQKWVRKPETEWTRTERSQRDEHPTTPPSGPTP